jgi:ATP-dependent Clp protease ATP-binding subunit ClpC
VRAHPFCVVLLDEFEKAHRSVWDLFLAVFDDGRLTDRGGRTTDFRHCVIILTSNVGSALPSGPGLGFSGATAEFHAGGVERAVRGVFRPELLNRFDRMVVFRPLGRDVMRALLEHELHDVLRRRGFHVHPWAVEWDEAALDFLLERGYTAELGARPMKRAIEQHLLAPLAVAIVERAFPEGEQFLFIGARGDALEVSFVDPDAPDDEPEPPAPDATFSAVADAVAEALAGKDPALAETREPGFWDRPAAERAPLLARVEYLDRLQAAWETAGRLRARGAARLLAERLHVLAAACAGLRDGAPFDAVLELRPSRGADDWAAELRGMYEGWASARGMRISEEDGRLLVSGLGAATILATEAGLHVFEAPERERRTVQVIVGDDRSRRIVRRYRRKPSPLVRDAVRKWRTGKVDRVLAGDFDVIG